MSTDTKVDTARPAVTVEIVDRRVDTRLAVAGAVRRAARAVYTWWVDNPLPVPDHPTQNLTQAMATLRWEPTREDRGS
jgi:hypothetical protein